MAIAFGAASQSSGSSVSSLTWAHTCSGTQRILVVGVHVDSASVLSVAYAGVAMTRITNQSTPSGNVDFHYLFTPATGANNIVATFNATTSPHAVAASYTGVAGPSPDASNSNGGTGTSLTTNVTSITNNSWIIGLGYADNGNVPGASGGSATNRNTATYVGVIDSNAVISPAGATSLTVTAGSSTGLRLAVMAIKPATASPTTTSSSSTSTSTSSSTSSSSSSSTSTSSTTTGAPPPDVQETGVPLVYVHE